MEDDIKLTPWSTIRVDPITLETNIEGVFSGGDAVWGAGTVIEAIGAGKEAAISIDRYINGENLKKGRGKKPEIAKISLDGVKMKRKVPIRYMPLDRRKHNFEEVELGYTEEEAIEEARKVMESFGGRVIVIPYYPAQSSSGIKSEIKNRFGQESRQGG